MGYGRNRLCHHTRLDEETHHPTPGTIAVVLKPGKVCPPGTPGCVWRRFWCYNGEGVLLAVSGHWPGCDRHPTVHGTAASRTPAVRRPRDPTSEGPRHGGEHRFAQFKSKRHPERTQLSRAYLLPAVI